MKLSMFKKLKTLEYMCKKINDVDKERAMESSKASAEINHLFCQRSYKEINFEVFGDYCTEISISRSVVEYIKWEKRFEFRQEVSWTDIPYDVLLESCKTEGISEDMISEVASLIRALYRHGWDKVKFGTYTRNIESTDYLDFEVKQ